MIRELHRPDQTVDEVLDRLDQLSELLERVRAGIEEVRQLGQRMKGVDGGHD